jgi:mono/diheme cytochrome c family protein
VRLDTRLAIGLLVVLFAAGAGKAQQPRSIWDGIYTAEQAKRGERLAVEQCVSCHGDRLSGGESAPALAGDVFNSTWEGVPLSDLADRIRTTMPQDNPSSLSRQQTADIVAYMLDLGTFPAGSSPLGTESAMLAQIKFESIRPQR